MEPEFLREHAAYSSLELGLCARVDRRSWEMRRRSLAQVVSARSLKPRERGEFRRTSELCRAPGMNKEKKYVSQKVWVYIEGHITCFPGQVSGLVMTYVQERYKNDTERSPLQLLERRSALL